MEDATEMLYLETFSEVVHQLMRGCNAHDEGVSRIAQLANSKRRVRLETTVDGQDGAGAVGVRLIRPVAWDADKVPLLVGAHLRRFVEVAERLSRFAAKLSPQMREVLWSLREKTMVCQSCRKIWGPGSGLAKAALSPLASRRAS
eukprot:scaffold7357_cov195-Pinguiococcus_pyrenoidosus.AAC.2